MSKDKRSHHFNEIYQVYEAEAQRTYFGFGRVVGFGSDDPDTQTGRLVMSAHVDGEFFLLKDGTLAPKPLPVVDGKLGRLTSVNGQDIAAIIVGNFSADASDKDSLQ